MNPVSSFLRSTRLFRPIETPARDASEGAGLFRRVFEQSPVPIVLVSLKKSLLVEANPAAIAAFGFEDRRFIGRPLAELGIWHDPADQFRYRNLLQASGSITGFEVSLRTRHGQTVDVLLSGTIVTIAGEPCSINFLLDRTERKRTERALAESEEKFHRAFDQSPLIVVLLAMPEGRLMEVNAAGLAMFGLDRATAVGRTVLELGLWADPAERELFRQRLHDTGTVAGFEATLRRQNGESFVALCNASLIQIGDQTCSLNTLQDITERKRAEQARENSASLMRATLESTADGILAIDAGGRIESYNQVFAAMWRIPPDVLAARDDDRALRCVLSQLRRPEAFLEKVRHLYSHPLEESFDTLEFADGRVFERYSRPMLVAGRPTGRVWSFRDITQRRLAEQALRENEEKFRGVFDKSPVIMGLLTVPEGRFVEVNAAGAAAFGYTREEALGRTSLDLNIWADPADRDRYLQLLKTHGSVSAYETRMRRRNGENFAVLYSGSLIKIGAQTYSLNSLQDITPRQQAERSLQASEQRYERVVQTISDALLIDDVSGHIVFANERFRQLFGLAAVDLRAVRLEDYVAPEYREVLRTRHNLRVRGEPAPDHYDYEAVRPDGTRFWVEVNVTTVVENGFITGTQSLNRDITDRKITEQAMLLLSTGTATLQGPSFFEHIAREVARLFGADLGLVARCGIPTPLAVRTLGVCLDDRIQAPMEYSLVDTPCYNVLERSSVVYPAAVARLFPKAHLLAAQGMEGYAAAPMYALGGEVIGHVAIASRRPLRYSVPLLDSVLQMITVKVAAEIERQRAESKFRDLFAFAPDSVLIATPAGVITDANQRALEMFGYTHAELTGLRVDELIPAEVRPELLRRLSLYLANPVPHPLGASAPGLVALGKSGRRFPIDISLSPLQSNGGLLVVAAIRDITDQVRAAEQHQRTEAQLRQAQKMESLGTLAGGIAHDFNNILTGMLGFVELARLDLPAHHPALEWLNHLSSTGDRAKNLVRQILTFGRKDEGQRAALSLPAVAEEAVRLLRATIPVMIEIETDFSPKCPLVMADSNQLHQVLINLCTNAWHALAEKGGRIRVAVHPREIAATADRAPDAPPPGSYVCLVVSDNGSGMDLHTQERIFDPFFTTKKTGGGTGLGLAVVHGIVQSHAGFITVHSAPGQGASFELFFPAAPAAAAPLPAADAAQLPRGHGESCLLLDDDTAGGKALGHLLEWLGYRVTLYHDPLLALARFRNQPAEFALVVSDLAMPGLTGVQFARHVRSLAPATPLLIISGFATPEQLRELRELGVPDILRKPPTLDELAHGVARVLGRAPTG